MEAKDFYFELSQNAEECVFLITPRHYYDIEGVLSDESNVAGDLLPEGFSELTESTYEFNGTPEVGRQLLIDIGMKEFNFGFQPGEPSSKSEEVEQDEVDNLLYRNQPEPDLFDYKNVSTDKLIRHMNMMASTEAFEEAAKIKKELDSRG